MRTFVLLDCTATTGVLLIQAAVRLNFRVVVLTADRRQYSPDKFGAAEIIQVNPWTEDAIAAMAGKLGAAGVYSCLDRNLETAHHVACRMALPAQTQSSVLYGRDKGRQRNWLRRSGGDRTGAMQCSDAPEASRAAQALGFPVVLKPVDQAGSVGTRYCSSPKDVEEGARQILTLARIEKRPAVLLVEKYVDGPQYSVEVFSGKVVGYVKQFYTPPPDFVAVGHQFPATLSAGCRTRLEVFSQRVIDGFDLHFGPAHIEVRIPSEGSDPVLIECNARIAGAGVPDLIREVCGLDLARLTVMAFTGMPSVVAASPGGERIGLLGFLHATSSGRVATVTAPRNPLTWIYVTEGERLSPSQDYRNRIGHGIAVGRSLAEAQSRLFTSLREVVVRDHSGAGLTKVYEPLGS